MMLALCVLAALLAAAAARGGPRYTFYRTLRAAAADTPPGGAGGPGVPGEPAAGTRRVFGGQAAQLEAFPGVCALLDRYWSVRCSGAVVAPRWVLTAAHCVTPRVAYVKYNTRRALGNEGDYAPVHYLYRHPKYKVVQEDEGRGMDVTLLHHDVGLVCTRTHMTLRTRLPTDPVVAMRRYNAFELHKEEVEVLGFGHTDATATHEELAQVRLELVYCERGAWFHCVCGSTRRAAAAGGARGVCAGDSGGPVMYRGVQVAVTSMGPTECLTTGSAGERSTSVFTALYRYADLVNATITDTESALSMTRLPGGAAPGGRAAPLGRLLVLGAALALGASSLGRATAESTRLLY